MVSSRRLLAGGAFVAAASLTSLASLVAPAAAAAADARFISVLAPETSPAPPEYPVLLTVKVTSLQRLPVEGGNVTLTTSGVGIFEEAPTSKTLKKVTDADGLVTVHLRNTTLAGGGTQTITASLSAAETSCEVPTAQPGGCSDSLDVLWSVHKQLGLSVSRTINVGDEARGLVTGSQSLVANLLASGPTDVGYREVRSGTITASGFPFAVHPRTNTSLRATARDMETTSYGVSVRPAMSLRGAVSGATVRLSGVFVPGRGGVTVHIYKVVDGVRSADPVATAITDSAGHWTAQRTFAARGVVRFVAVSLADQLNLAGTSNRLGVTLT